MTDRFGVTRIQEELGDQIRVYSLEEWNRELAKRGEKPLKSKETPVKPKKAEPEEDGEKKEVDLLEENDEKDNPLIKEDNDKEDDSESADEDEE